MVHAMDGEEIIKVREPVAVAGEALEFIWEPWPWFMQWMMRT